MAEEKIYYRVDSLPFPLGDRTVVMMREYPVIPRSRRATSSDPSRKFRSAPSQKTLPTCERNGMRPPGVTPKAASPGSGIRYNQSFATAVSAEVLPTRNSRSVWSIASEPYKGAHFATFPSELPRRCILAGSRPGDTVLDPFGGSGTTGAVARELGRSAILIELQPAYLPLIRDRVAQAQPPLFVEGMHNG